MKNLTWAYLVLLLGALKSNAIESYNESDFKPVTRALLMHHFQIKDSEPKEMKPFRNVRFIEDLEGNKLVEIFDRFYIFKRDFEHPVNATFEIEHKIAQEFNNERSTGVLASVFGPKALEEKYYQLDKGTRCKAKAERGNDGQGVVNGYKCECHIYAPLDYYQQVQREYLAKKEQQILEKKLALQEHVNLVQENVTDSVTSVATLKPRDQKAPSQEDMRIIKDLAKRAIRHSMLSTEYPISERTDSISISFDIQKPNFGRMPHEDEARILYGDGALPNCQPDDFACAVVWAHMKRLCGVGNESGEAAVTSYGQKFGPNQLFIKTGFNNVSGELSLDPEVYEQLKKKLNKNKIIKKTKGFSNEY
jgi:hypothetical protein